MCLSRRVVYHVLCYSETKSLNIDPLPSGLNSFPKKDIKMRTYNKTMVPSCLMFYQSRTQGHRLVLHWGILAMVLSLGNYEHFITVSLQSLSSLLHIWELYISVPVWPRIFRDFYLTDTTTEGKMKFSMPYIRNQFTD